MQIRVEKWVRSVAAAAVLFAAAGAGAAVDEDRAPNMLVVWGHGVGPGDIGAYADTDATPNIDRIASEGALFTRAYAAGSGTAAQAAFVLGQNAFRTGLLSVGEPRSAHGIPDWAPTIADVLGERGYVSGHFGLSDVGSRDVHLPTRHGFDEFYGLLHDPALKRHARARGIVRSRADGWIEDTGPLKAGRAETADDEFVDAGIDFMEQAVADGKPFLVWVNTVGAMPAAGSDSSTSGHDEDVGRLLDRLDALGIADDTIVIYAAYDSAREDTADPAAADEALRAPLLVRWPGVIEPGTRIDDLIAEEDWLPTLAAAAGGADIVRKLGKGYRIDGRRYRVHIDGHDFLARFSADAPPPRDYVVLFDADGNLDGVHWAGAKANFAILDTSFAGRPRHIRSRPVVTGLDGDTLSTAQSGERPAMTSTDDVLAAFVASLDDYPAQENIDRRGDADAMLRSHAGLEDLLYRTRDRRPRW